MGWIYVVNVILSHTTFNVKNVKIPIFGGHNKFQRKGFGGVGNPSGKTTPPSTLYP
jgi:hypothetical protein